MQVLKTQINVLREIAFHRPNAHLAFLCFNPYCKLYNTEGGVYELLQKYLRYTNKKKRERFFYKIQKEEYEIILNNACDCPLIPLHFSRVYYYDKDYTLIEKTVSIKWREYWTNVELTNDNNGYMALRIFTDEFDPYLLPDNESDSDISEESFYLFNKFICGSAQHKICEEWMQEWEKRFDQFSLDLPYEKMKPYFYKNFKKLHLELDKFETEHKNQ